MAQINDDLWWKLEGLGFPGALPNKVYAHLGSLGHTGAMNDRLAKEGGFKAYVEGLIGGYNINDIIDCSQIVDCSIVITC